jgi:predicted nucleic acid-binding protein
MTTTLVVDSSIVPKWFVPEIHADAASRLRVDYHLVAPEFLLLEVTNILVPKVRRGQITQDEAGEILQRVQALPIELVESSAYLAAALDLASRLHPSGYDCLYAAVALARECRLVTADREFYDHLRGPYPGTMLWVEDIPEPGASTPD